MKTLFYTLCILSYSAYLASMTFEEIKEKATAGNPQEMITMYTAALDDGNIREALSWSQRYKIRLEQDAACCRDTSVRGPARVALRVAQENHPKSILILKKISARKAIKVFKNDLEWVEQKTKNDELPSPHWIAARGLRAFLEIPSPLFINEEDWRETRLKIINQYKKELEEQT
jgi:hypothetical protein